MFSLLRRYLKWATGVDVIVAPRAEVECTCGAPRDRHARRCALVRSFLADFGMSDPMVPDWPIPDVVDLSNTRFSRGE